MIVVVGEILFDVFEGEKYLGGAPFNFAYHLHSLGYDVRFLSRVGDDPNGHDALDRLEKMQFPICDIQIDHKHDTGKVNVHLDGAGSHEFDIVANVAYDYFQYIENDHIEQLRKAKFTYFGSLIQRTELAAKNIHQLINSRTPFSFCLYDINLRPHCYTKEVLEASLLQANIFKLNMDELLECKRLFNSRLDKDAFIHDIMNTYSLHVVSLTKGGKGSDLYTRDGCFTTCALSANKIIDSVGAGDAYAAMLAVGLMNQWPAQKTVSMASHFASRICEIRGAIPESVSFYDPTKKMIEKYG